MDDINIEKDKDIIKDNNNKNKDKNIDNDWYDKLINDKNFDSKLPFNSDRLFDYLESAAEDPEHLKPFEFLGAIYEFTRAFGELSSALSMGFSDITSKVEIWRILFKKFYKNCTDLQSVMITEVMMGIHELNGENNYYLGQIKESPYYTYVSGTRTLLRLSWFLDFLRNIFKQMIYSDNAFNLCVTNAYQDVLAPRHPWLVRKGAGLALSFAPKDKKFAMKIFFSNLSSIFKYYSNFIFFLFKVFIYLLLFISFFVFILFYLFLFYSFTL
jgi:hypothetical protein